MKAMFLTLLLCFSCTKYAEFNKDSVGIQIQPVTMGISHLNEVEWDVGLRKEETISQSFTFIIDLPRMKKEDLDYLTEQKGIDAWILRLIVTRGSESQDLGSLYALFQPKKVSRGVNSGAPSSVTMKVYYAAAYASQRFRSFKCPAFSHNKKIASMDIMGSDEEFAINVGQATPYNEKSQLVELTPSSFNGGNSLVGNYFVEIAAYDSKKKMILSSFKRIPMYVKVSAEESIRIKSCDGIHPEIQ
jgi:hypothetical protein